MTLREQIVEEARSWIRTPFHHEARVKGQGVDCGMLLAEVFEAVGLVPHVAPEHYPPDFMLHRNEERYLDVVLKYAVEVTDPDFAPLPGDIVLFQHGRVYSHGGVVISWPKIIHASFPERFVVIGDATQPPLSAKKRRFFRVRALL